MSIIYDRPKSLADVPNSYCPGCTHGIIQRIVCENLDELEVGGQAVGVLPVGCAATAYAFYDVDNVQAAHGRAQAVATGIKRAISYDGTPSVVFTYQGDGDLASIGMAETVHAATRGENITVIFVNNAIYGMTGGQMSPTTLPGQITQTSPFGRDIAQAGNPIRVCELLSSLDGPALIQRVTVDTPANVAKAKKAIKKGFQYQIDGMGYSLIEVVATCPTNWGLTPQASFEWMRENMLKHYPLGVFKDVKGS